MIDATQNQATGSPVTPADIMRSAALYLSRHGWTQNQLYAPRDVLTPPACIMGALYLAATGRKAESGVDLFDPSTSCPAIVDAVNALEEDRGLVEIDEDGCEYTDVLSGWNDRAGRTAAAVMNVLRECADRWDTDHLACSECGEYARAIAPTDWPLAGFDPTPAYSHADGTALCPVIGATGYVPTLPTIHYRAEGETR